MPSPRFPSSRVVASFGPDARPRLTEGVTFERAGDERWVTVLHGVPSSRVSSGVVELLSSLDGENTLRDLHRRFAASDPPETFLRLIERFRENGLLDDSSKTPPGRVSFRPPFTVQLATMHAPALFARLTPSDAPVSLRTVALPLAVLLGAGIVAAAVQWRELRHALVSPLPFSELLLLVVALAGLTLLHECAHGMTLTSFGGRPRRAGVMLFYLAPAFFVDVTDGWRLRDRRQRVAVALAGPAVHGAVGAVAIIVALAVEAPEADRVLQLLALSCAAIVIVNLIPFVRFDGYLALMSALDEPNLRDRCIGDAMHATARTLFGVPREVKRLDRRWSVPFGIASIVTPIVLVLLALARIADALAAAGPVGGVAVVVVEAAVLSVGVVLLLRGLRRVLRAGAPPLRFGAVVVALIAGVAVAGGVITVPVSTTYGFFTRHGQVVLVQAATARPADVPTGAPVTLLSTGLLGSVPIAQGTARPLTRQPASAPLDAFLPVTASGASLPAEVVADVAVDDGYDTVDAGRAQLERGTRSLWEALWETGVEAPLSSLLSDTKGSR